MERLSVVHAPIHIEGHEGGFVRYFASPQFRATGGPDLHRLDDDRAVRGRKRGVEACEGLFQPPPGGFGRLRGALRRGCTVATKAQVPHLSGARCLAFHLEALEVEGFR
jgi:hypothetical protein